MDALERKESPGLTDRGNVVAVRRENHRGVAPVLLKQAKQRNPDGNVRLLLLVGDERKPTRSAANDLLGLESPQPDLNPDYS